MLCSKTIHRNATHVALFSLYVFVVVQCGVAWCIVLCYTVVSCCVVSCCVVCCGVLCCVVLYCGVVWCSVVWCGVLTCCIVPFFMGCSKTTHRNATCVSLHFCIITKSTSTVLLDGQEKLKIVWVVAVG